MDHGLRQILVHLDSTPRCAQRLQLAQDVARRHGASIAGAWLEAPLGGPRPYAGPAGPLYVATLLAREHEQRRHARALFEAAVAGSDVPSRWVDMERSVDAHDFIRQALYADLVVLGQYDPEQPEDTSPGPSFVPDVVIASGRPVLAVPHAGSWSYVGRTVLVAWKECREAARAVASALPWLRTAQAVHVVAWGEEPVPAGAQRLDLAGWLRAHGVQAQWHREAAEPADDAGALLMSRACDVGADLLVMGLYGHSRLREWVLGGASRGVLQAMTVPVLMAH